LASPARTERAAITTDASSAPTAASFSVECCAASVNTIHGMNAR
jgi:hypothetical protein